jgi:hypothetical protein
VGRSNDMEATKLEVLAQNKREGTTVSNKNQLVLSNTEGMSGDTNI